jgi:gamma-butyrobetaine dioxygenase
MRSENNVKNVFWTPAALTLEWFDEERSEFPSLWLRDNCPLDRDPQNGQRLIDITDLPPDPKISRVSLDGRTIRIEWLDETQSVSFEIAWLRDNSPGTRTFGSHPIAQTWLEGSNLEATKDFAWATFPDFRGNPSSRFHWMTRLVRDGIAFMSGVACAEHTVLEVARYIGIISETNYGRDFDVRFVPQPENLADSDRGLGLHTDNPYRDPVPGFQTLHFLIAAPEGGESRFADGFAIAEFLYGTEPALFDTLTQTPVLFFFRSKDAELCSEKSLIQLSPRGDLKAVHYNSRSIAPVQLRSADIPRFYTAYRRFATLLGDDRFQLKIRLNDGDLVAFDNHRILHGRSGFCASKYPRHLQGCYLTRDSVLSQLALLKHNAFQQL